MCVVVFSVLSGFFFFKQKTAYELRISDWSSDVCSSDRGVRLAPPSAALYCAPRLSCRMITILAGRSRVRVAAWRCTLGCVATAGGLGRPAHDKIGRASCRERVWQYV